MLPVLLSVVVISFSGVMLPGPFFAVLLAKSYRSSWAGTQMSLGHAVIEIPIILVIYFGFAQIFQNALVQLVLSVLGGGMIVWMGVNMFRVRAEIGQQGKDLPYNSYVAGIVMTGFNPFFLLWWATIGSLLIVKFLDFSAGSVTGLALFIVVHWVCDVIWTTFVSNVVHRTHRLWAPRAHEWLFIACSLLLVGFGMWFVVSGVRGVM